MNIVDHVDKLRGRSPHEIRVRGMQALRAIAERQGWSAQCRVMDDATFLRKVVRADAGREGAGSLLERFRTRTRPRFFPAFHSRKETLDILRRRWPDEEKAVLANADRICSGQFDLLGRSGLRFGDPIDWRLDPVTGRRTPSVHWSRIDHLDPDSVGEYKVTWELNRHAHFIVLGKAFWYSGDEKYADIFVRHITEWMEANPPTRGINWASSLEVAFRAIAWTWALYFFRDSRSLTPEVYLSTLKFLNLHAQHIEKYLSTYFSPNTHITGEALGLFYLGTFFPELRASRRWRDRGVGILMEQLDRHVLPDGVYFERATYYHRYTAEFYTHLLILCQENDIGLGDQIADRLQALLDHLMFIARPDGTTPLVGDDDGGKLVRLDRRPPNDFRSTLATGAVLFGRDHYRFAAEEPAEETLWLLGPVGMQQFDALVATPPAETSRAFRQGGYFVMRDGWDRRANYLLVDCGPHGTMNCGHAHADALSMEIAARGETMVVDPGTLTYISPPELRDRFRDSAVHSTLSVDGESSSVPDGPFQWKNIAECTLRSWISSERFDFFEGSHDGYSRLSSPALHIRGIFFLKGDYWVVQDRVVSNGKHRAEARLQFAPGVELLERPGGLEVIAPAGATVLEIETPGDRTELRPAEGLVSRSYGEQLNAPYCVASVEGEGTLELVTFLLPRAETQARYRLREFAAGGGRAFRIAGAMWEDVLLMTTHGPIRTDEFTSDCNWAWLRRESGGALQEYLMIGGTSLDVAGRRIFGSRDRASYVSARIEDGVLRIETDGEEPVDIDTLGASEVYVNGRELPMHASMAHVPDDAGRRKADQALRHYTAG